MQARDVFNKQTNAWLHGANSYTGIGKETGWHLPIPSELELTADEIEYARPWHSMTIVEQMANMQIDPRQERWYAEAIQQKYCSCHMQRNSWYAEMMTQGVHLPRDELQHLICLACEEQPKKFVLYIDLMED